MFVHIDGIKREREFHLFTTDQTFCDVANKEYILYNIIHFVPKIFFWFKIDYATQIAIRFIVKLLSATDNCQHISWIIDSNEGTIS